MPKTALIDGDILVYSCGFASDVREWTAPDGEVFAFAKTAKEYCDAHGLDKSKLELTYISSPLSHTLQNVKQVLAKIKKETKTEEIVVYLTGATNYRNDVPTEHAYKGNRDPNHKPTQYNEIIKYLTDNYNTVITEGEEADDAMGIAQSESMKSYNHLMDEEPDTVICTKDKDLNMITGLHYNWAKSDDGMVFIEEFEALLFFHTQLLTGDAVDNIKGLEGIGPKKAAKILQDCKTPNDMFDAVLEAYAKAGKSPDELLNNGRLLWIRRTKGEMWNPQTYCT